MILKRINLENRIWKAFYIFATIASVSLVLIAISCMFCSCESGNNNCKYDSAKFVCDFRTIDSNDKYSSYIDVADYTTYSNGVIEITATNGRIYRTHISNVVLYSSEDT